MLHNYIALFFCYFLCKGSNYSKVYNRAFISNNYKHNAGNDDLVSTPEYTGKNPADWRWSSSAPHADILSKLLSS